MKTLIKKILNESEWFDDLSQSLNDLPFEISSEPTNRPKFSNVFKIKTVWEYGESVLRESFVFQADDPEKFETFINVCAFYSALMDNQSYDWWQEVSSIAKNIGLSISSYEEDSNYGTPKDMSDFIFGSDYPAYLSGVKIYYYDKGGVEYNVKLKNG